MAVFEVLEMTPEIERIVLKNPVDSNIWAAARAQGMLTMREDAMLKSFAKLVPFSEVETLRSNLVLSEQEESTPPVGASDSAGPVPNSSISLDEI
jgi:hypothetical protein